MNFKFPKAEKLKSRKLIEELFKSGKSIKNFPVLLVYLPMEHTGEALFQAGFSVSKRKFKHAVDRNRIKRLMREAYRLNKNILTEKHTKKHIMMFVYMSNCILTFKEIQDAMIKLMQKFN
jgi:ribonuclease P protein component